MSSGFLASWTMKTTIMPCASNYPEIDVEILLAHSGCTMARRLTGAKLSSWARLQPKRAKMEPLRKSAQVRCSTNVAAIQAPEAATGLIRARAVRAGEPSTTGLTAHDTSLEVVKCPPPRAVNCFYLLSAVWIVLSDVTRLTQYLLFHPAAYIFSIAIPCRSCVQLSRPPLPASLVLAAIGFREPGYTPWHHSDRQELRRISQVIVAILN